MELPKNIESHAFLGEDLLIPNVNKCDGGRVNMFTNHQAQLVVLNTPEIPRVFTRFENMVGKYSSGLKQVDEDTKVEVLEVVEINAMKRYVLTKTTKKGSKPVFDLEEARDAIHLTEYFGYKRMYHDDFFKPGSKIGGGGIIHRNASYDEQGNLRYGVNLLTTYLAYKGMTYEDAIVISEEAASKLSHTQVEKFDISLNRNDILVNLYGNKTSYHPIPSVGKKIEGGYLAARRRVNYSNILFEFKEREFSRTRPGDTIFYADGIVADIEVYSNLKEEEFASLPHLEPFYKIHKAQKEAYTRIKELYEAHVKKGHELGRDFGFYYQKAKDYLDGVEFSYNKRQYDGLLVRVTTMKNKPCVIGMKLSGRYGDKGVISAILPKEEMPKLPDGRHVEVCLNPLGVAGRMNIGQNYEHELNFIANDIVERWKDDPKQLFTGIINFLRILDLQDQADFLEEALPEGSPQYFEYLEDVKANGLYIHQPPFFGNVNPYKLEELYKTFQTKKIKLEGIHTPLVVAEKYIIVLKHIPAGKLSVRSADTSTLRDTPLKPGEKYKAGNALFNTNPVQFGEQELLNFLLLGTKGKEKTIARFMKAYSASKDYREYMNETLLVKDVDDIDSFADNMLDKQPSNTAQVVRAAFAGLGIKIVE